MTGSGDPVDSTEVGPSSLMEQLQNYLEAASCLPECRSFLGKQLAGRHSSLSIMESGPALGREREGSFQKGFCLDIKELTMLLKSSPIWCGE